MITILLLILSLICVVPTFAQNGYWYHDTFIELRKPDASVFYVQLKEESSFGTEKLDSAFSVKGRYEVIRKVLNTGVILKTDFRSALKEYYISDIYTDEAGDSRNETIVLPRLSLQVDEETTISSIINKYKDQITLEEMKYDTYTFKCNVSSSDEVLALASELHQIPKVKWCDPERIVKASNDGVIYGQKYLHNDLGLDINIDPAWEILSGDSNIVVAVLDCGVDFNHPDLTCVLNGYTIDNPSGNGSPTNWNIYKKKEHGIACAGIIAADYNNDGIRGIASGVKILPINIFPDYANNLGEYIVNNLKIAEAINWAGSRADVLNCSWDISNSSEAIENAINNVRQNGREGKGSIVVASSGNNYATNSTSVGFPAILSGVIAVGGLTYSGNVCSFSQRGTGLDLVAIGEEITTLDRVGELGACNGNYLVGPEAPSGTSFACSQVAGVIALMLSANPNLTEVKIHDILKNTSQKLSGFSYNSSGWSSEIGYGLVDAGAAVRASLGEIIGPDIPCGTAVYSIANLPSGLTVSWSWSELIEGFFLLNNTPTTNSCTILNDNKAYINGQLIATIKKNGVTIATRTKYINTGADLFGYCSQDGYSYPGWLYSGMSSYPFVSGDVINVFKGPTITLVSSNFAGANITYSGTTPLDWTHNNNTITFHFKYLRPINPNDPIQNRTRSLPSTASLVITGKYPNNCKTFQFKVIGLEPFDVMSSIGDSRSESVRLSVQSTGSLYTFTILAPNDISTDIVSEVKDKTFSVEDYLPWRMTISNSLTGKIVYSSDIKDSSLQLETADWSTGIYVIEARIGSEVLRQKFIIAR